MKPIIRTSLLLLVLLLPATGAAYDFCVDGIYYNANGNEASVTYKGQEYYSEKSYSGAVTIPASVTDGGTTYTVTDIEEFAMYECSGVTSVSLPNTIKTIGGQAFLFCSGLASINFPNSLVKVGNAAFYGTAWYDNQPDGLVYTGLVAYKYKGSMPSGTTITLRDGTTSITDHAFYACSGLVSISIPNSVKTVGEEAFTGTAWLDNQPDGLVYAGLVAYKYKGTMPNGTTITLRSGTPSITGFAFDNCSGLTKITIPNTVTQIGISAFRGCSSLTSVNIPYSVTDIGKSAFNDCSGLTSITVASGNAKYDSRNNCNAIIMTATNTLIRGCKNTSIPNTVTTIADHAFYGCTALTRITIPNSITRIGNNAFFHCTALTSISIPNSVTVIDYGAFSECVGLTSVTIPNSVTEICYGVFSKCSGLTRINLPNTITAIGGSAFDGCSALTSVSIPNSVLTIGDFAFGFCHRLTSITIPNSVISIDSFAFTDCIALTSINIPNSVTHISENILLNCPSLASITVDSSNSAYDSRNNCNAIIETATNSMISGCKNTVIPNTVTEISNQCFYGCSALTSINIPKSVTYISGWAFMECPSLSRITVENGNPVYDSRDNCKAIIETASNTLIIGCKNSTIPNTVTRIGYDAFCGSGLTRITIPNSVTEIGWSAFHNCSKLTDIYCFISVPPMISEDTFNESYGATLNVPMESVGAYQSAQYWCNFSSIKGIGDAVPGDADSDGKISIADVTSIIDYMLGRVDSNFNGAAADVNGDGAVNIADIVDLIDILLQ